MELLPFSPTLGGKPLKDGNGDLKKEHSWWLGLLHVQRHLL